MGRTRAVMPAPPSDGTQRRVCVFRVSVAMYARVYLCRAVLVCV